MLISASSRCKHQAKKGRCHLPLFADTPCDSMQSFCSAVFTEAKRHKLQTCCSHHRQIFTGEERGHSSVDLKVSGTLAGLVDTPAFFYSICWMQVHAVGCTYSGLHSVSVHKQIALCLTKHTLSFIHFYV